MIKYLLSIILALSFTFAQATTQTIHPIAIVPKVGSVTGSYTTVAAGFIQCNIDT